MGGQPLGAAWTTCSNCGLPLKGRRPICKGCGTIVPVDRAWARVKNALRYRSVLPGDRRTQATSTLWLLAVTPFLIAPPLLATLLAWQRRNGNDGARHLDPTFLTIVAIGNVIFSVIILLKFRSDALALWESLLTGFTHGHYEPARAPKLTPI